MNSKILAEVKRFLWSTLGIIIFALCINYFAWKFKLISGGIPGYALGFNYLTGFSVGSFLVVFNTILVILNFFFVGKAAGIRAIYGYLCLGLFIDLSRPWVGEQVVESSFLWSFLMMTGEAVVAALGVSMVLANGYSFGNYSSLSTLVQKFYKIDAPKIFLIADILLIFITIFTQGWYKALFLLINSIIFYYAFKYSLAWCKKVFVST